MKDSDIQELINRFAIINDPIRTETIDTLTEIGEPAIPLLFAALKDEDKEIRYYSVIALGKIAEKYDRASSIVPYLLNTLQNKDENWVVKIITIETLVDIMEPPEALPILISSLLKPSKSDPILSLAARPLILSQLEKLAHKALNRKRDYPDYTSALKIIKETTAAILELNPGKDRRALNKRKEQMKPFAELTERIHRRMVLIDKKKFPVKRQDVRRQKVVKKPLKALYMK